MDAHAVNTEWTDTTDRAALLHKYASGTYAARNKLLAAWVAESKVQGIIEVAAGCYDLSRRILAVHTPERYLWTDGDTGCVAACRHYLQEPVQADNRVAGDFAPEMLRVFDALICVSMEHLPDDVGLVENTAPGTQVFLGGASFPSEWHVRYWRSVQEMAARYPMLDVRRTLTIPQPTHSHEWARRGCNKFILWGERT